MLSQSIAMLYNAPVSWSQVVICVLCDAHSRTHVSALCLFCAGSVVLDCASSSCKGPVLVQMQTQRASLALIETGMLRSLHLLGARS